MQQHSKQKAYRVAYFGMLTAAAFLLGFVESLIPFSVGIYGVKLGIANLAVIITLYRIGGKEALSVSMLRVLLTGFTFGNMSMMLYSLAGGLLSWLAMILAKKMTGLSVAGVSILGGIFHNAGQLIVAALVLESLNLLFYGIVLFAAGIFTGLAIGLTAQTVLRHLPDIALSGGNYKNETNESK